MINEWMVLIFLGSLFFVASLSLIAQEGSVQAPATQADKTDICSYDRSAILALDERAFDQDLNGGWRTLARQEPCLEVAADLIRDYRESHGLESTTLYWHEGQLRATHGATAEAIQLFEKSRDVSGADFWGWNIYVNATVAFLNQDKVALVNAREELARLPKPDDWQPPRDPQGNLMDFTWPPNLNVVDMLVACFGQEYKEAYGRCEK